MLNGRMDWWSNIGNVVEDIRRLVVDMYVTDVLYQPRKGNGVAHALTQFGLKEGSSFVWTAPPWLDCLLGKDVRVVFLDLEWIAGDIGELQPNGAMKIMDRKKNIFKLSQGEYVAVENIESKYLQCPLITSIWVYGNSFESFLVAVVVADRKALEDWAAEHHLTDDFKSLCQNLKARKYILDELNSVGQKQQVRR
ncbi:unnamed protein product [Prunus armeniaca]